jgi:uncharacterized protein involved in outer membrane biogenesis
MRRKVLVGALGLVVLVLVVFAVWVRAVFTQDAVRAALAAQLSAFLGQPVSVGALHATAYPRVAIALGDVTVGQPPRIRIRSVDVRTDLGALLSRRIEHGALRVDGATIDLPLPAAPPGSSAPARETAPSSAPVRIVSIDEVAFHEVQITSGGRALRADLDLVPQGQGFTVRRLTLNAEDTSLEITGQISDLSGPAGDLTVTATRLNFDRLMAFVSDFAGSAGFDGVGGSPATQPSQPPAHASAMNIVLALNADEASMGALNLQKLSGRARLTGDALTLDPVSFGFLGGGYRGDLALSLGPSIGFKLGATVSGVDMAAVTKFAGGSDTITGRLSGRMDLTGKGLEASSVLKSARGTGRVEISNGIVRRLGLAQAILIATSGRTDAAQQASTVSSDEPFTRISATLAVADGSATSQDLAFESKDFILRASGSTRLDGSAIKLAGEVQLSDALSRQAGRDLARYTQEQGRVTLPVTVSGSIERPQVHIDTATLVLRAFKNRASQEEQKAMQKGLGRLFGK